MNAFKIINVSSIIIYTKIIDITFKTCFFFILSVDQSLEILPKHNGLATIDDDDGNIARGVFVDFQKAFDIIDHQILLGKIDYYGIRGILNERLKS